MKALASRLAQPSLQVLGVDSEVVESGAEQRLCRPAHRRDRLVARELDVSVCELYPRSYRELLTLER